MIPATRKEAQALGSKYYFTGKPCVRGHIAKRYTSCKVCVKCNTAHASSWQKENKEHFLKINKEASSRWRKRNKGHRNSLTRAYQAAKLNRCPKWADLRALREFYENCPTGYEVDHIIPLRGKQISGLHVLENL